MDLLADSYALLKDIMSPSDTLLESLKKSSESMAKGLAEGGKLNTGKLVRAITVSIKNGEGAGPRERPKYTEAILNIPINNVTKSTVDRLKRESTVGIYTMERNPRGRCVIINNEQFETGSNREGSNVDEANLRTLFTKLYFDVEVWRNVTRGQARTKISKESKNPAHLEANAFIFIAMSHGAEGTISTVDGGRLKIKEDIVEYFGGRSCPALAGKPKIFLIQACRGGDRPVGVPKADSITQGVRKLSMQGRGDVRMDAAMVHEGDDVFIAYPTVPGFVSWRDNILGSYFMREFVITCSELAHKCHLSDILTIVADNIKKNEKIPDQQVVTRDVRMSKHVYFFPGYSV